MPLYDVVIAGSGLAGGSLAVRLARSGARVAVIDPGTFPRDKLCGEYLSPEGGAALERLHLADAVAKLGAHPIRRVRITTPRGRELVAEVIDAYRAMLLEREALTRDGLEVARADAAVALNTLKTLEAAVSLQSQMLWSSSEFESLMEISPPELIPLDDEEMFHRFLDVSRELATS